MSSPEDLNLADDASDLEVARYERAVLATRRVLDEAIRNLSVLVELEQEQNRRKDLEQRIAQLEGERSALVRANVAFHSHTATMVPPSPDQIAEFIELANEA